MEEELIGVEYDQLDSHLFRIEVVPAELEEIIQFLENGQEFEGMSTKKKKNLAMKAAPYSLINEFLYKLGLDEVLRRCILEHERERIMHESHYGPPGGHFQSDTTAEKIQHLGLWWQTLYHDCLKYLSKCDLCQR